MSYTLSVISWELYNGDMSKNISHTIALPNRCLDRFMTDDSFINAFIVVSINNAIQFGNCEIVYEYDDIGQNQQNIIVVPHWVISKLGLELFDQVIVAHVSPDQIHTIGRIKICATISDYALWADIKTILETELSSFRIINYGDVISIQGTEFYIVELLDKITQAVVLSGSIYNTDVELDFDVPMDDSLHTPVEASDPYLSRKMVREHNARLAILDSMTCEEYRNLSEYEKSREPRKQKIDPQGDSDSDNEMHYETVRFPGLFSKRKNK